MTGSPLDSLLVHIVMPTEVLSPAPRPLAKRLAAYGCTNIIRLDETLSAPEQLDYLDLLPTRTNETRTLAAVAAHQGTALLYIVNASGRASAHFG